MIRKMRLEEAAPPRHSLAKALEIPGAYFLPCKFLLLCSADLGISEKNQRGQKPALGMLFLFRTSENDVSYLRDFRVALYKRDYE